ncbi:MAG: tRNA epoxyqueuosine(34) reductase QueG [Acidimicrobiia bacterium]|nr:tRNA epoxyqueuosine(34) reductase QueG [Acidimicrobiia bacterium]MYH54654.1 tRNA epoxyqueuosine(34) reductase QueG [Acidimicrobiia bacterium]
MGLSTAPPMNGSLASELIELGRRAGLTAVGVCRADPFARTEEILVQRKEEGLHGGMQFTYRNPARSTNPARILPDAAALVVGALDFWRGQPPPPDDGLPYGRVAAYARQDHYTALRDRLKQVADRLGEKGFQAVVVADENHLVDRAAAYRAGLGWWGKSANLLLPEAGSLVVLGAVVTDAPLCEEDPPPMEDGCGSCRQCLDGCPTGAIVAPGVVDARRCLAWLVQQKGVFPAEYRVELGDRIYGCDDCAEVCPPNRIRVRLDGRRRSNGSGQAWVSLVDLLESSDEELMARFGRWYIPRRQPRYLRRNALVALGNVGDPSEPRVRSVVGQALGDSDPLVRAHAVWCARRLGLELTPLRGRNDPLVQEELQRPVTARLGPRPAE